MINLFKKSIPRERLKAMYVFTTNKAIYTGYNTQTIQGKDCVNIEIEQDIDGKLKVILEKEIFDDSWGSMGGTSFYTLVIESMNHLREYIKSNGETIQLEYKPGLD